ncbi:hypothetical protein [Kitasatospora sp. NPDC006786]|uniref:hypothetical protein n=1 Tax=unclassified Kitasatospora TaxID=2633591 RepID=UPI0033CBE918
MTTTCQSCALPAGLAALAEPAGWTGRAVKCVWPETETAARVRAFGEIAAVLLLGGPGVFFIPAGPFEITWTYRKVEFILNEPNLLRYTGFRFAAFEVEPPTKEMLLAALAARWAAIVGDHAAVDDFTRNVLGHRKAEEWRDAVISGLLDDWVDRLGGCLTDPELLRILRAYTAAERRRWTELWEHRSGGFHRRAPDGTVRASRGKRVWLLETPNRDGVTVRDVCPDKPAPGALALDHDFTDPRVDAVLRGLDATEAAVANLWASRKATWADAALDLGLPAAYGDRVRRKLGHLGDRHTERALAAAAATR